MSAHCGCLAELDISSMPDVRKLTVVEGVGVSGWVVSLPNIISMNTYLGSGW